MRKKLMAYGGDDWNIDTMKALNSNIDTSKALFGKDKPSSKITNPESLPAKNRVKLGTVLNKFSDVVPYISNIANAFRTPPMPRVPDSVSPVYSTKVNYDNQRNEVRRSISGANANADKMLDENTAAAVRGNNLAQGIRATNDVNENEANTNAQLDMRTRQINAGIDAQNTGYSNQFKQDAVGASIAQSREQSENLANAADKYVASQNEQAKSDLDIQRLGVYSQMFKNSGVMDRVGDNYQTWLKENNLPAPQAGKLKLGNGGYFRKYGEGGGPLQGAKYAAPGAIAQDQYRRDAINLSIGNGTALGAFPEGRNIMTGADGSMRPVINSAVLFNQRKDLQGLSPEQRIQKFYESNSTDPAVMDYRRKSINAGTGVLPNYQRSPLMAVQQGIVSRAMGGFIRKKL